MRRWVIGAAAIGGLATMGAAHADQLVQDGGFEAFSPTSPVFSTTYVFNNDGTHEDDANGNYYINTDPHNTCSCFTSLTGHGNQLIVDGAAVPGGYFWQESFGIAANSSYTVSFDAANLGTAGPQPSLKADVNGILTILTGVLSYDDTYVTYTGTFASGAATSATLSLTSLTPTHQYNDFAVDNISFVGPAPTAGVPEPASWALMIGGFGLVGGVLRRAHRIALAA